MTISASSQPNLVAADRAIFIFSPKSAPPSSSSARTAASHLPISFCVSASTVFVSVASCLRARLFCRSISFCACSCVRPISLNVSFARVIVSSSTCSCSAILKSPYSTALSSGLSSSAGFCEPSLSASAVPRSPALSTASPSPPPSVSTFDCCTAAVSSAVAACPAAVLSAACPTSCPTACSTALASSLFVIP